MPDSQRAAILLGSNLGDRKANLIAALSHIEQNCGKIIKTSPVYSTEPWGLKDQPGFLNQAALLETSLEPLALLECLMNIEQKMGRIREQKWAARTIDLDILHMGSRVVAHPQLAIPHPFLPERRFSLLPLNDVDPDWDHPVLHKNVAQLIADCPDSGEVYIADEV